jgi:hypothetical protein
MYLSASDFYKESDQFNKETPIYIDQNLGNGTTGDQVSKKLHDEGFTTLYLATGYNAEDFTHLTWLKGIVGKEGPWA